MAHRHSSRRYFVLSKRTGKIAVQGVPGAALSKNGQDNDFTFDTMLAALNEAEAIISPALDKKTTPPSLAVMFLGEAIYLRMTGEEELTSPKLRAMFCQFVLAAWESGQFTPSAAFPYTYEEVATDFNTPLEEKEDTLSPEEIDGAYTLVESLSPGIDQPPEHLREIDRVVRGLMIRGLRAMKQKQYKQAEDAFLLVEQLDVWSLSQARFSRAMALVWQRKIIEASALFTQDAKEHAGDGPLSWLFSEWCSLCIAPSRSAYLASLSGYWVEVEEEDLLMFKEQTFEEEYGSYLDEGFHAIATVFFAFLAGEGVECLAVLGDWKPDALDIPLWAASFLRAMVLANNNHSEAAHLALQQAIEAQIPPLFLLPLRWFAHSHTNFYEHAIKPLFTEFGLWTLISTCDVLTRTVTRSKTLEQVKDIELELPGFAQVYTALEIIREQFSMGKTPSDRIRCHYLDATSREDMVQAYAELIVEQLPENDSILPIFVADIPPLISTHPPAAFLINELLDQLYDPLAYTRVALDKKREHLMQLLQEWGVELIILTGIEHLTTPAGKKLLLKEFECLRQLCVNGFANIPVLLVGNRSMIERLRIESPDWENLLTTLVHLANHGETNGRNAHD